MLDKEIKNISSEIEQKIISIRREFHRYPEPGFNEFKTSAAISNHLRHLGLEVKTNIAKTGVIGFLRARPGTGTIAIRADMDALPIEEENDVDYISLNQGVMHACGHDAHAAIVLGAAEILARLKDRLNINVMFIFQPAEEGLGGAKYIIDEGALEGCHIESIIAAHVMPGINTGNVSIGTGPFMASSDRFEITIHGRGGHAAMHHNTVDPITIGANLVNLFQTIISREKNPLKSAVLSVTGFNAGSTFNIIPDCAVIKGTVRAFDPSLRDNIKTRMEEMASSVTKAMGAGCSFNYRMGYPPVVNHKETVKRIISASGRIIPESNIITNPDPVMLGEDFSYYTQIIPGAMFFLGCTSPEETAVHNLHSSRFNIDESCLKVGMEIMAQYAADFPYNE